MTSSTSPTQIRAIAKAQSSLLIVIAFAIALMAVSTTVNLISHAPDRQTMLLIKMGLLFTSLVLAVVQVVEVVRLCLALGDGWATVLFALLMFIPCVSLLTLLILNSRATTRLKQAGIRVGLLGAKSADLANYQIDVAATPCRACGEPVAVGVQTCPMCGATV